MSPNAEIEQNDAALMGAIAGEFADAPELANPAWTLLKTHFGTDPSHLPVASDSYVPIVSVHLQNAVDKFMGDEGREHELHGLALPAAHPYETITISKLIAPPTLSWPGASLASPDFVQEQTSSGRKTVLRRGLYLVRDAEGPAAIWLSPAWRNRMVDVMAPTEERARAIIDELRQSSYELNPFKGQVITVVTDCPGNVIPIYLERPREVSADEVILPEGMLQRIEEHAMGLADAREVIKEAGHSLKRGILLYGRPGTGKTHTIRYLISQMTDYTVLTLPASRMELMTDRLAEITQYVTPGIMIFDDVDFIAEDRSQWFNNTSAFGRGPLFSLLELMDGIGKETDLLFVLTTNVADRLEEAIAARPGRIDQAFEIPAPDAECRKRLFELYAKDVTCAIDDMDAVVARTEGVTGSFLKELIRRSIVVATLESDDDDDDDEELDDVTITDSHVNTALDQLLDPDNEMTARLLGAKVEDPKPTLGHVAAMLQRK